MLEERRVRLAVRCWDLDRDRRRVLSSVLIVLSALSDGVQRVSVRRRSS